MRSVTRRSLRSKKKNVLCGDNVRRSLTWYQRLNRWTDFYGIRCGSAWQRAPRDNRLADSDTVRLSVSAWQRAPRDNRLADSDTVRLSVSAWQRAPRDNRLADSDTVRLSVSSTFAARCCTQLCIPLLSICEFSCEC